MCLSVVKDEMKKPTTLIQSGWKEFNGNNSSPQFTNFEYKGSRVVPLDQWLTAETKEVKISMLKGSYAAGFHIWEDEMELPKKSVKRRVYYRNVHTRGMQNNLTVVIAQQMYVPSDPDGWPPL